MSSTCDQHRAPAGPAPPRILKQLLEPADVQFNGSRPWDIIVHAPQTYSYTLAKGSLGFGEACMEGHWDCDRLDDRFTRIQRADIDPGLRRMLKLKLLLFHLGNLLVHSITSLQSVHRARIIGERHYGPGNDIFRAMLDLRMNYRRPPGSRVALPRG